MSDKATYRLADSTAVEPLINKWAVWPDLVSPAPYSMHLVNYQLKTLRSYLSNPQMHLQACANPKFLGGPFVDVPAERAGEVGALLEETEREQSANIKFAHALTDFYNTLNREAKGQSLEPFYGKVPEPLRGYVELLYDYYSHPVLRLLESLLYASPYYREGAQSLRLFQQPSDDARRSFISTPRLPQAGQIDWKVPFADARVDELFKLDSAPQPLGRIREVLDLAPDDEENLRPLLTEAPAPPAPRWEGPGVRVRYFGHACVLVEWNGVSVLTDPWLGVVSREHKVERLTYKDLPEKIDYVLITHGHHDHFVLESLLRLRHRIGCLVVPQSFNLFYADVSLKLLAKKMGFRNVVELLPLESVPLPGGEIVAVPFLGEHADLAHGKSGYCVRAGREQILFAADSNCLDKRLYEHVRGALGPVNTIFLGMECVGAPLSWLYGAVLPTQVPHSHDQTRRTKGCDSKAALDLLDALGGTRVYIYAMGQEPWFQYSMGLGLSPDAPQIKESNSVLAAARERGYLDAQRPYGKYEIFLEG